MFLGKHHNNAPFSIQKCSNKRATAVLVEKTPSNPLFYCSIIPFGETPKFILLFYETYLCQEKHALVDRPPCVGIQTRLPLDISFTCLTKPPG